MPMAPRPKPAATPHAASPTFCIARPATRTRRSRPSRASVKRRPCQMEALRWIWGRRGLADRRASVELDGGTLDILWREDGHVIMTGPAAVSFEGTFEADLLAAS